MSNKVKGVLKNNVVQCVLVMAVLGLVTICFAADVIVKSGTVIVENDTYVKAADNAGTGTVDLIKANASDVAVLPDGAELAAATQSGDDDRTIADKGYVDDNIGDAGFGDYGSPTSVTSSLTSTETNEFSPVQASTDLLLVATCRQTSNGWNVVAWKGYTGSTSNPTTYRAAMSIARDWGSETWTGVDSFMMFVKKDDYYVVKGRAQMYSATTRTYTTIPIGN